MYRKLFLCLVTLLIAGAGAGALGAAQSILPLSFAKWTLSSKGLFVPSASNASQTNTLDQTLAVAKEYGFESGEQARYVRGGDSLDVVVYRMSDVSGAYGEFSYLRTPDMPDASLTKQSAMSRERALVLVGNLLLDIRGHDLPKLVPALKSLIADVNPHAEKGILPGLPNELPIKGFVERTDRYVLGPEALNQLFPVEMGNQLGFSQGAEAELGNYLLEGREATLMIVDYPTPQVASTKLRSLQQQFNINDSQKNSASPMLYAKRSLTKLIFVAGAKSQAEANELLNQIETGTQVTWNEPTWSLTEPNIGTMIVGTIIGTGVICLFALISGLAFGGVRLVIKRALPNKVFDRSEQLQILQLGLSSKPIKAEDFYG